MKFYIVVGTQRKGPFTLEELAGQGIQRDTLVWHEGRTDWVRADQVPLLNDLVALLPPPVPPAPVVQARPEPVVQARPALGPRPAPPPAYAAPGYAAPGYGAPGYVPYVPQYRPGTFKTLYMWWVILFVLGLVLPGLSVLFIILGHNEDRRVYNSYYNYRHDRFRDNDFGDFRRSYDYDYDYAAAGRRDTYWVLATILMLLGAPCFIAGWVMFYILLFKCWGVIQDGHARTSAGQAVGFMFIPFFNLYWLFVAIYGLAEDHNNYARRHGIHIQPVSVGLGLATSILWVACVVPFLNFLAILPMLIMLIIYLGAVKTSAATIAQAKLKAQPAAA